MESAKVFCFPDAGTELSSQVTTRIQNILQCPSISRYEVTYKLYRRQNDRLITLQFYNSASLYCLCDSEVFELSAEYENVLLKLKTWSLRQTIKILGSIHDLNGSGLVLTSAHRLSVGTIIQGPSSKGMVLELRETPKDILQRAPETGAQMLAEILGPFQRSAYKSNASAIMSTGSELGAQIKNLLDHTQSRENVQMALCYFELFSKI